MMNLDIKAKSIDTAEMGSLKNIEIISETSMNREKSHDPLIGNECVF